VPKTFAFVAATLLVSVLVIGFFGYKFGEAKTNAGFVSIEYDLNLKKAAENAIAAVNNAITNGNSAQTVQKLTIEQNNSIGLWNTHKERIDKENAKEKGDTQDEGVIWGLVYVVLSILYEGLLFAARIWHEKEDYAVLKSKLKARKKRESEETAEKQPKTPKKQEETAKMSQNDVMLAVLDELRTLRTQKSLLEEALAAKK
jgi:hypothetical protein